MALREASTRHAKLVAESSKVEAQIEAKGRELNEASVTLTALRTAIAAEKERLAEVEAKVKETSSRRASEEAHLDAIKRDLAAIEQRITKK